LNDRSAARARGHQVAEDRLVRATSLLQTVTPAERAAIEETAYAIAAKVVDCVLDEAARWPAVAALSDVVSAERVLPAITDQDADANVARQRPPLAAEAPRPVAAPN
jgi:hypothetical protein